MTMWNSKPKRRTCNCRRRSRHNPKVGGGICYVGYREAFKLRLASKRLARAWLAAAQGGRVDDFEG